MARDEDVTYFPEEVRTMYGKKGVTGGVFVARLDDEVCLAKQAVKTERGSLEASLMKVFNFKYKVRRLYQRLP